MKPNQAALFVERFDSSKHELSDFVFTSTVDKVGFAIEDAKSRTCRMRYLLGGDPAMADDRKFRMLPEDCATLVGNCKKRLTAAFIPQLTEHGWGPDGGKACGKHLDVYEQDGNVWTLTVLTEHAWADAVDPGLGWLGRSAGLRGWLDLDGFIRPADMFEGSFTNFPAMKGLGNVEPMSAVKERFSRRMVFVNGLYQPDAALAAPEATPLSATANKPPSEAGRKEQETMKFSADDIRRLGLPENATQEQAQARFEETLALAAKPAPKAEAATTEAPLSKAETIAMLEQMREEDRTKGTAALRAEFEARDKAKAIDAVLFDAEKAGKLTAADREKFRAIGVQVGADSLKEMFERFGAKAPSVAVFEPGHGVATPLAGDTVAKLCAEMTAKIVRRNNVPGRVTAVEGVN